MNVRVQVNFIIYSVWHVVNTCHTVETVTCTLPLIVLAQVTISLAKASPRGVDFFCCCLLFVVFYFLFLAVFCLLMLFLYFLLSFC